MYKQIGNIIKNVARSTQSSLLAISAAHKSLSNIEENPKSLSDNQKDVLNDIEIAREMINELEDFIIYWIQKYHLKNSLDVNI